MGTRLYKVETNVVKLLISEYSLEADDKINIHRLCTLLNDERYVVMPDTYIVVFEKVDGKIFFSISDLSNDRGKTDVATLTVRESDKMPVLRILETTWSLHDNDHYFNLVYLVRIIKHTIKLANAWSSNEKRSIISTVGVIVHRKMQTLKKRKQHEI